MLRIIGDVHGKIKEYTQIVRKCDHSIQVGDMGLGFRGITLPVFDSHKFIRGNHDSPKLCREHPNHLGDYGIYNFWGRSILYVAGGYSLDQAYRLPGVSWWHDEELAYTDFEKILDLVKGKQIDMVVSHEAPMAIVYQIFPAHTLETKTAQGLEAIRKAIKPKLWVFGHYHIRVIKSIDGCQYIGLDELDYFDVKPSGLNDWGYYEAERPSIQR